MRKYKDILVAKGSDLYEALEKGDEKLVKKVYSDTTDRYKKLYPDEDRSWFGYMHRKFQKE